MEKCSIIFFCPREKSPKNFIRFLTVNLYGNVRETQNIFFSDWTTQSIFPFARLRGWRERRRLNENVYKNWVYIQRYLRKSIASRFSRRSLTCCCRQLSQIYSMIYYAIHFSSFWFWDDCGDMSRLNILWSLIRKGFGCYFTQEFLFACVCDDKFCDFKGIHTIDV